DAFRHLDAVLGEDAARIDDEALLEVLIRPRLGDELTRRLLLRNRSCFRDHGSYLRTRNGISGVITGANVLGCRTQYFRHSGCFTGGGRRRIGPAIRRRDNDQESFANESPRKNELAIWTEAVGQFTCRKPFPASHELQGRTDASGTANSAAGELN